MTKICIMKRFPLALIAVLGLDIFWLPATARQNLSALPPSLQSDVQLKRKTCYQAAKEAGMNEFLICGETEVPKQAKENIQITFLGITLGKKLPQSVKNTDKENRGSSVNVGTWMVKPPQPVNFGRFYIVQVNSENLVRSVEVIGKTFRNTVYSPQSGCKIEYLEIKKSLLKAYGKPVDSIDLEESTPLSRDPEHVLIVRDSWKIRGDFGVDLTLLRNGNSQNCYTSLSYSKSFES